jgi:hypothetical protein
LPRYGGQFYSVVGDGVLICAITNNTNREVHFSLSNHLLNSIVGAVLAQKHKEHNGVKYETVSSICHSINAFHKL